MPSASFISFALLSCLSYQHLRFLIIFSSPLSVFICQKKKLKRVLNLPAHSLDIELIASEDNCPSDNLGRDDVQNKVLDPYMLITIPNNISALACLLIPSSTTEFRWLRLQTSDVLLSHIK